MSRIIRSTDIQGALRARQRGFIINPYSHAAGGGPAAPTYVSNNIQNFGAVLTYTVNPPAGTVVGDYLIAVVHRSNLTASVPAGWTAYLNGSIGLNGTKYVQILTKIADGSDSFSQSGPSSQNVASITYRIQGPTVANSAGIIMSYNGGSANATSFNFPANTPAGGPRNYLAFAILFSNGSGNPTAFPTGFTNSGVASSNQIAVGRNTFANVSTVDPDSMTFSSNRVGYWGTFLVWT